MQWLELKIPPPVVLLLFGTAMWAMARAAPELAMMLPSATVIAVALAVSGVFISLLGMLRLSRGRHDGRPTVSRQVRTAGRRWHLLPQSQPDVRRPVARALRLGSFSSTSDAADRLALVHALHYALSRSRPKSASCATNSALPMTTTPPACDAGSDADELAPNRNLRSLLDALPAADLRGRPRPGSRCPAGCSIRSTSSTSSPWC